MTYKQIQAKMAEFLVRDDLQNISGELINMAMRKIERKFNFRHMKIKTNYALLAGTDTFANPIPNYKELIGVYAVNSFNRYNIQRKDSDFVEKTYPVSMIGYPVYIAEVPNIETLITVPPTTYTDIVPNLHWMIRPIPDVDYTVTFVSYQYSPYLDGVDYKTNWWTVNAWDILLYGSLIETEPYAMDDKRIPIWKEYLTETLLDLVKAERIEQFSGSLQFIEADNVY